MLKSVKESKLLEQANSAGGISKFLTYTKISGPGIWLTLAALSAGSMIGSIGLGQRLGSEGLWVQAWAMLLGMFVLWAISHITLNSQHSLFTLLKNDWNPSLGWWLAASAMITNFAWCMPQFRFGADITGSVLLPFLDNKGGKVGVALCMLAFSVFLSFWYERSGFQSKLFQWVLRLILWGLGSCLFACIFFALPNSGISLGDIMSGFLPRFSHLSEVSGSYEDLLAKAGDFRFFWEEKLLSRQKELTLITFSSTLGVNLLFALPLLLLGRGWKRTHNGFAKFNLFWGLLVPFILCSSCLTLLSSIAHHKLIHKISAPSNSNFYEVGELTSESTQNLLAERIKFEIGPAVFNDLPPFQIDEKMESLASAEKILASLVLQTHTKQWIGLLTQNSGHYLKYLLGISVFLISFSTILVLMVLNGHLVCEVLSKPHKGPPFQSGSLILALSSVGPFVFSDQDSWVADPTYFLSLAILPYALLSFLLMLNSKDLLGRQGPKGLSGLFMNFGSTLAFLCLGLSSFFLVWNHMWGDFPIGQSLVILIGVLLLIGYFSLKNRKLSSRISGLETRLNRAEKHGDL